MFSNHPVSPGFSFSLFLDASNTVASEGAKVDIKDIAHVRISPYIRNHACTRRCRVYLFIGMVCCPPCLGLILKPGFGADRESVCSKDILSDLANLSKTHGGTRRSSWS